MNNHDKLIQEINQISDYLAATLLDIVYQLKNYHPPSQNIPNPIQAPTLNAFIGASKNSPSSLGDPVAIQQMLARFVQRLKLLSV
ncbi:MAG: hypothetical protein ACPGVO_05380 [Spirulinaceae cyanobacterium]